jgi:hypothetical protein
MTMTIDQRRVALVKGNAIRTANSRLLTGLRAMRDTDAMDALADLLETPDLADKPAGAVAIFRLLRAIHRYGWEKSCSQLRRANVMSGDRRARDLTDRQRTAIAADLRGQAAARRERG